MQSNNIKLIINGRFLGQKLTGVQNYASGIVKALQNSGFNFEIVTPPYRTIHTGFPAKEIGFFRGIVWEQFFLPFYVRKQKGSILVNLCNSAPLLVKRQIVTIHDLAFEEKTKWYNPFFKMWYKFMIPRICRKSLLVITVSEFSKRKIIEHYKINKSKIIIAPPGTPEFEFKEINQNYGDYAILTGVNNHRKNACWIIENIDALEKNGLTLIVLGTNQKSFRNSTLKKSEFIIYPGHLSFPEYCSLLKNAKVLIYPSFYEGFGIPILESLCLGTPVIASNIPAFKETFGELPIYFELGDSESFSRAIDSLKTNKISKEDIANLKNKFNFESSLNQILNSIKLIM